MSKRASRGRLGLASVVALGAVMAFAAIGGTSLAAGLVKPAKAQYGQGQYNNASKVTVCHKGKVTIRIAAPAVPAHRAHGDTVGACALGSAAKANKAKGGDSSIVSSDSSDAKPGKGNAKGKKK